MEPPTIAIPVRSKRQAMDWSLVLASQGIESTIQRSEDGTGWSLLILADDYSRAMSAITQYRLENRGWPWQQKVLADRFLFDWGSLCWLFLVILFFWLTTKAGLYDAGLMDSTAVAHGQWWRLFTAIWLHAEVAHLAANATFGFVFLGLALARFGTGTGLLAAYLAGAAGNIAACLFSSHPHHSLGASGMVMGSLGLLAVQSRWYLGWSRNRWRHALSALGAGLMLFIILALSPNSDIIAHVGGFGAGLLLGGILTLVRRFSRTTSVNLVSGLLFTVLVVVPWWLALRAP